MFAYGQTGSGKTFTITAATHDAVHDLFKLAPSQTSFSVGFFEIYGGKAFDLLNGKKKLMILEDANNKIQIHGLEYR